MSRQIFERSNFSKLATDKVYISALQKFDDYIAVSPSDPVYEIDKQTNIRRKSYGPGSLVAAPVKVGRRSFHWPAIVEFPPQQDSHFVRIVTDSKGVEEKQLYVTLITVDRSSWFGAWVNQKDLRPFNMLTTPKTVKAPSVPDAEEVFTYAKLHLPMTIRDRLLKLSFTNFVAYENGVSRWEIRI